MRLILSVDEVYALCQFFVAAHERGLRDADRTFVTDRFDEYWESHPFRQSHLPLQRKERKARHGNAMVSEDLFREGFVVRQRQSPRVASRIFLFSEFKVADDMLVKERVA